MDEGKKGVQVGSESDPLLIASAFISDAGPAAVVFMPSKWNSDAGVKVIADSMRQLEVSSLMGCSNRAMSAVAVASLASMIIADCLSVIQCCAGDCEGETVGVESTTVAMVNRLVGEAGGRLFLVDVSDAADLTGLSTREIDKVKSIFKKAGRRK